MIFLLFLHLSWLIRMALHRQVRQIPSHQGEGRSWGFVHPGDRVLHGCGDVPEWVSMLGGRGATLPLVLQEMSPQAIHSGRREAEQMICWGHQHSLLQLDPQTDISAIWLVGPSNSKEGIYIIKCTGWKDCLDLCHPNQKGQANWFSPARSKHSLTFPLCFGMRTRLLYHSDVSSMSSDVIMSCCWTLSTSSWNVFYSDYAMCLGVLSMVYCLALATKKTFHQNTPYH